MSLRRASCLASRRGLASVSHATDQSSACPRVVSRRSHPKGLGLRINRPLHPDLTLCLPAPASPVAAAGNRIQGLDWHVYPRLPRRMLTLAPRATQRHLSGQARAVEVGRATTLRPLPPVRA